MLFAASSRRLGLWAFACLNAACGSRSPHSGPAATTQPSAVTLPLVTSTAPEPTASRFLPGCPPGTSCEAAARELAEANRLIARAGEHPTDADLASILPLLERAAYSGYVPAQLRFGHYVVGYWYTDELFWPRKPKIAVAALAMLRVAAKASPESKDSLVRVLAKDPVAFGDADGVPPLPSRWVNAALAEAARWEKSRPAVVRIEP